MHMKQYKRLEEDVYMQICSKLNIDPDTDLLATEKMHSLLSAQAVRKTLRKLKTLIKNKWVFIFAPGPSLIDSLEQLNDFLKEYRKDIVVIAVDGASQALLESNITIDSIITDLDGSLVAIRESFKNGSIIVIHAHGDNMTKINEIKDIIPKEGVLGTTQTKETTKLKNLGGFTDGDRAAFLVANFGAKKVILVGFDFGDIIGRFSKPESNFEDFQASERKLIKFTFAKKLLAKLPNLFPRIKFYNLANNGEDIENIPKIQREKIKELVITCD